MAFISESSEEAKIYHSLRVIRRVEEEIIRLYPTDKIKSPIHLSIGQEAVAVGVCEALRPDDVVFGTYRGHALYLAKGGDLPAMIAELYGKANGCARGKAGSMHLAAPQVNMMGTSAIVATGIPQAVGYALALKMRRSDAIVAVFFGEGSTDEGVFHESVNFAALKRLPILFICENNDYAIYSPVRDRMAGAGLCPRVETYGIPARRVEDGDVFAVVDAAREAAAAVRAGEGPRFLECMTYRWYDHVGPGTDRALGYRSDAEVDARMAADPVARLAARLDPATRAAVEAAVEEEIAAAIAVAEAGAFPGDEELYDHVFCA